VSATAARGVSGPRSDDCRTRGRTVTANSDVRIFVRGNNVSRVYAACDLRRRVGRPIGRWHRDEWGVSPLFALNGRTVLNEYLVCPDPTEPCGGHVDTLDVRTGRERYVAQFSADTPPASDLVLGARGAVAWIRSGVVSKVEDDQPLVLDAGPGVEAGSLAVAGDRLYWTRAGTSQTHVLGPGGRRTAGPPAPMPLFQPGGWSGQDRAGRSAGVALRGVREGCRPLGHSDRKHARVRGASAFCPN
jgi:hypothetical protein